MTGYTDMLTCVSAVSKLMCHLLSFRLNTVWCYASKMTASVLFLSGGGIRCVSTLGAMQYLEDNHMLDNIDTTCASSAGALIAYLWILGYTPMELMGMVCTHKLFTEKLAGVNFVNMLSGEGATSFYPIQDMLEQMTLDKCGRLPTFQQLRALTGKSLIVSVLNYDTRTLQYLSCDSHADMPCIMALRMTTALPLIFPMVHYMGARYIDPGFVESFPLGCWGEVRADVDKTAIGIRLRPYFYTDDRRVYAQGSRPLGAYSVLHNLLTIPSTLLSARHTTTGMDIFDLDSDVNFIDFRMSTPTKLDLFSCGYRQIQRMIAEQVVDEDTEVEPDCVSAVDETTNADITTKLETCVE